MYYFLNSMVTLIVIVIISNTKYKLIFICLILASLTLGIIDPTTGAKTQTIEYNMSKLNTVLKPEEQVNRQLK